MEGDFVEYTTQEGELWSNVAFNAYGDETLTAPIIAANPRVPIRGRLDGNITLYIPILSYNNNIATQEEQLPPWRQ